MIRCQFIRLLSLKHAFPRSGTMFFFHFILCFAAGPFLGGFPSSLFSPSCLHLFHKRNTRVVPSLNCPPAFTYCHLYYLSHTRVSTPVLAPFSMSTSATRVYMGIACLILLMNQLMCFHGVKSFVRNRSLDSQKFPRNLQNLEIYYRLRKRPSLVSNLSQISPMHASPSQSLLH